MSETSTPAQPPSGSEGTGAGTDTDTATAPAQTLVSPLAVGLAMLADAVAVVVFAAIGRASHDEDGALLGTLSTAWPFLVALSIAWIGIGWAVVYAIFRGSRGPDPLRAWPVGVAVWIVTVAGGMALRTAVGEGAAFAFILVAAGFNLLTLVGWRLLAGLAVSRSRRTR